MLKPAVVLLLVVGLLLTATPAALCVEALTPSVSTDEDQANHPQLAVVVLIPLLEIVDGVESSEDFTHGSLADGVGLPHELVPKFHVLSVDSRNVDRSRVPAVSHGRSPPA